ncbi:MAG TPA: STM3941 family protein [Haliscomenobacter sp.]|uniref:STM3941 family protein n=1 Tax=Haliscomenobacter sp. TaxID=2717303 RepID=UPI002C7773F5|nr:STM3941 family protein [Haliscomenobacter sp.]HOY20288.1 STM3941 family protein [Haliscomenobacter sp.]
MTHAQPIEIPLSKTKLLLLLIGSLAFVALGVWLIISRSSPNEPFWAEQLFSKLVGCAAILFFGSGAFWIIRKLFDRGPGLIIDEQGLTDNSSAISAGQILWTDIEAISVLEIQRQKLIMLQVKNPQDYIDKQPSGLKRKLMNMNFRMYGTPLSISSNGLKISFAELLKILNDQLAANKEKPNSRT